MKFQLNKEIKEIPLDMNYKIGTKEKSLPLKTPPLALKKTPLALKKPPLTSGYAIHLDQKDGKNELVCTVVKTDLLYHNDCLNALHIMLKKHGDWMELGSSDEQKPAKLGTVEAWGRAEDNPVGGLYGLKKG